MFLIVVLLKGTWKFLCSLSLYLLNYGRCKFLSPYCPIFQRNMEISMFLIVVLLKGTWKFICSSSLYYPKEHGNFYALYRCTTQRNMEISMLLIIVLLKGIRKFLSSLSLYLSNKHENFHVRLNSISVLVLFVISSDHMKYTLFTKHH